MQFQAVLVQLGRVSSLQDRCGLPRFLSFHRHFQVTPGSGSKRLLLPDVLIDQRAEVRQRVVAGDILRVEYAGHVKSCSAPMSESMPIVL